MGSILLKMSRHKKSIEMLEDNLEPLVNIEEIQEKTTLEGIYEEKLYSFKEGDKSYLICVSLSADQMATARLLSIKQGEKTIFEMGRLMNNNVSIKFTLESHTIEIVWVSIRNMRGICTRSVAYTMKALLHCINKKNMFAPTGKVRILSQTADRAFNCYNRAFLLNGYTIDRKEYEAFQIAFTKQQEYNIKEGKDDNVNFTFEKYINKDQRIRKPNKLKF